jgi:hypothetical protein
MSYKATPFFIPHLQRCDADDGRGSDFGRCSRSATGVVCHEGHDKYVCTFHLQHYTSDPVVTAGREPSGAK